MEAAPEVLRRLEFVIQVGDEAGAEAGGFVHFRKRRLRLRNRPPPRCDADEVALDVPKVTVVERKRATPRVDRASRTECRQRFGISALEAHRFAREGVEMRRR